MQLNRTERLALLVHLLGEDAEKLALEGLSGTSQSQLKEALKDFEKFPPSEDEVALVVSDFEESFRLALASESYSGDSSVSVGTEQESLKLYESLEESFPANPEPELRFEEVEPTGNAVIDLNRLHPYQVSTVLRDETPQVIAMVARRLSSDHAAKTIELLPEAVRASAILNLSKGSKCKSTIEDLVLETVCESARKVSTREQDEITAEQMAELLRTFPKSVRGPLLTALAEDDEEVGERVKALLFSINDIVNFSDRDVQSILAECKTPDLVLALQDCDEEVLAKILSNMSRRAKETLQEEMEFAGQAKKEEIDDARAKVVKVIVELDESGKISTE